MSRTWRKSIVRSFVFCLALAGVISACKPAHAAPSPKSIEKQAHKIEIKLARYPKGAFLHLFFRDGSDSNGKLGNLSENTFNFTNSDSNADETHSYADVTKVEKGKEYIGEGPGHKHIHIF